MLGKIRKKLGSGRQQGAGNSGNGNEPNIFDQNSLNVKDMFTPDGLENLKDRLQLGADRWCRVYVVHALPRMLQIGWLDEIFYRAGDVDVSIHMEPAPDRTVINSLIRKETQVQAQYVLDQKAGNISRLPEQEAAIADYRALREAVQLGRDRLFFLVIFIAVHANTEEELRHRCGSIEDVLARKNVRARALIFRQEEGLKSILPVSNNKINDFWKNLTTGAAACCLPASTAAVGHPSGILLGFNISTGAPIFVDRFAGEHIVSNQHLFISGEPGSGKSVTSRLIALREGAMGVKTVFVDPEGEYVRLAQGMGGHAIRIVPGTFSGINVLDIEPAVEENEYGEKREVVNIQDKVAEVQSLVGAVVRYHTGRGLGAREIAVLEEAIREEYTERGITADPESLYENGVKKMMPTLSTLHERVKQRNETLADVLRPMLADGSLGMFDGQTTLKLSEAPMITFSLKNISVDFTKFFATYVVLGWVWQKFAQKGGRAVKKSVLVDEAWMFMRHPDAAYYLEILARRGRKHGCGLIVATQRFEEFASTQAGRSTIESCATVLTLKQEEHAIDAVIDYFKLAGGCREILTRAEPGMGILRLSGTVTAVQVTPAPFEWQYVETNV